MVTSKLFPFAVCSVLVSLSGPVQAQSAIGPVEQTLIEQGARDVLLHPGGVLAVPSSATRTVNQQQAAPSPKASEYEWGSDEPAKVCNERQKDELTFSSQGEYGPNEIGSTANASAEFSDC